MTSNVAKKRHKNDTNEKNYIKLAKITLKMAIMTSKLPAFIQKMTKIMSNMAKMTIQDKMRKKCHLRWQKWHQN